MQWSLDAAPIFMRFDAAVPNMQMSSTPPSMTFDEQVGEVTFAAGAVFAGMERGDETNSEYLYVTPGLQLLLSGGFDMEIGP